MKSKKAFTLIELLVVIAIIGILTTVAVVALNNARAKARDAKRVADIKQIQTALELFYNDMGRYPTAAEFNSGSLLSTSSVGTTTYMAVIPEAPAQVDGGCLDTQNQFIYLASANESSYTISYCLGGTTGSLVAGPKCANPSGVTDADCSGGGVGSSFDGFAACGDTGTYGGEAYATVEIGTQCWFAKNINIGSKILGFATQGDASSGIFQKWCYDDSTVYCNTYGALYQWHTIMGFAQTCDSTDCSGQIETPHQGICPTGWHIPTDDEWTTLINYLGGASVAGTELQVGGSSGFVAQMGGIFSYYAGFCTGRDSYNIIWSASPYGTTGAWQRTINAGSATVVNGNYWLRGAGLSARCLMD